MVYGGVKLEVQEKIEISGNDKALPLKEIGQLGPGKYFGESALVNSSRRSATITTVGKSILLSVEKESFHNIFDSNSQLIAEFELRVLGKNIELNRFLGYSCAMSCYRSWIKNEMAEENLDFWLGVKSFEESTYQSDAELIAAAKAIYVTYCDEKAERQVNISGAMLIDLRKILENGTPDKNTFSTAKQEIYNLMVNNSFSRFKSSPEFSELWIGLDISV